VGRPDFNSGEMRNACLVGSTPMSFRHFILCLSMGHFLFLFGAEMCVICFMNI